MPNMKKQKRTWTAQEMKLIESISALLGTNPNLPSIYQSLEQEKACADQLRARLRLQPSKEFDLSGMLYKVDQLFEDMKLELTIKEVLKGFSFRRARLLLTLGEVRSGEYEATLSAREVTDLNTPRMPFVDVVEIKEKKTVVLDRSTGTSMVAAVAGLKPR